ncbi:MAG: RagB/SusD family nutrient uptake outer membrane protein [Bacteroidales bacterium]
MYGGVLLLNAELLGGDGEILWVGTYTSPREIFNKAMYASNSDATTQWTDSYQVINTANNVLSAIDVVAEADQDRVEGEALFLRSLVYFDLVRFYALQYEPGVTNNQYGVPLIITPTRGITENSFVGRSSVEDVYTQVVNDLTRAITLLPEDNGVYASSGAAEALLARVYLQMGDYANARDAASNVIESGNYALMGTYEEVFNNDNNSAEDIFATQITPQDRFSSMTEFFSTPEFGGRGGDVEVLDPGHIGLYDPADERLGLFYDYSGATQCGKWNNQYGVINLIRLAEMYLIRAECNFREGTVVGDTPLNDYNAIHTRAGLTAAGSIVLDDILYERRLELAFEGFKIHDMRRLQQSVGTLPYDDPKLVFPIPAREIEANPTIASQQNEGY